ncbi:ATP phosphoribosyltransferase regulatory subunit [Thiohalophilus sp.]|uniref:ATP phosphoribosyltransferase regulatory subunit n=1 Tax=Thiohalophilus sp. TaxID=3028392 RepID=UPI002ACE96E6|nr:ATP phosphoribosyltransferase regulatory subunit [Thiohalophilus sp.]MDZ7662457.1 ATP phosphoribosyltransferase regulatory subunit [Thiohalophilus sp.]
MKSDRWLLPEGIEEVLPQQARRLEALRRRLLDLYAGWGYELVMPPMIEYLDSLLTGTGHDLDLQTFKLTDQLTGKLMGLRADMTPQVARIDAHTLKKDCPTRLCYIGSVLHTRSDGFAGSRSPIQVGAELYGHSGSESDVEVFRLMLETLRRSNIRDLYFDLGHVGIYRQLVRAAQLSAEQESELFDALQRKAIPEIEQLLDKSAVDKKIAKGLLGLAQLNGDESVIGEARRLLAFAGEGVSQALDNLQAVAEQIKSCEPSIPLHFDLAELRGYNYHTGVVFAAYVPGCGQSIAQGGRYDDIGQVFGRARPATGFSTDLKTLIDLGEDQSATPGAIYAPGDNDAGLRDTIEQLRRQGERVISALPGDNSDPQQLGCDRKLVRDGKAWQITTI